MRSAIRTHPTGRSTPRAARPDEKFAPRWRGWGTSPAKPGGATMAEENDKFWKDAKGKLRRAYNLDPMCREEAEEEVKRTKNSKPMSDDDVNSIMDFVLSIGERGGLP